MLGLEAVAVVLLPVEALAGVGGQLLRPVDIVPVVLLQGVGKAAGVLLLQLLAVQVGDAPDDQRVLPPGRVGAQQLDGRAQRPRPDGEDKGGLALIAELYKHPVPRPGDELAVILVPDIDIAEIVVRAGAVLRPHQLVHPGLVAEGDGLERDRRFRHVVSVRQQRSRISFLSSRRSIKVSGRLEGSRSRAEG